MSLDGIQLLDFVVKRSTASWTWNCGDKHHLHFMLLYLFSLCTYIRWNCVAKPTLRRLKYLSDPLCQESHPKIGHRIHAVVNFWTVRTLSSLLGYAIVASLPIISGNWPSDLQIRLLQQNILGNWLFLLRSQQSFTVYIYVGKDWPTNLSFSGFAFGEYFFMTDNIREPHLPFPESKVIIASRSSAISLHNAILWYRISKSL